MQLQNNVSEYELQEITYMEQLKFCESLLGSLNSRMCLFIVPSPSVCPKDLANINMQSACVACGLPLLAYNILCVCMIPCGHPNTTLFVLLVGLIRMKPEVCTSLGCKELFVKAGQALLSPKGNVHKLILMSIT